MTHDETSVHIGVNARTLMHDQPGGAIQVAHEITTRLARRNDGITLFGHRNIEEAYPNTTVKSAGFAVKSQLFGLLWEQSILPLSAAQSDVDVLFCPNANNPFVRPAAPRVICVHDILNYLGYAPWYYTAIQRVRVPLSLRTAETIVTVSEFTKGELVDRFDIAQDKIQVVYNGVDDVFFDPGMGTETAVPDEYVLFVGGAHKRKNIDGVVEGFKLLKRHTDLPQKLLLVGPGPRSTYDDTGIDWTDIRDDPDIVTPGYVDQQELKYIYEHADVFVFPSYYEGFGIPPLEAMACGTPVVASDRAALPEVLGDAAEYVDPDSTRAIADAIDSLLDDNELYRTRTTSGRERAQRFRWGAAIDQYQSILEETAKS
ncbi:glycosyltransferase family 4 protein [Halosimplex rubrum]|uniref:Glycosyltransferase family 4 protein n=1 Tax=Halosimplex rubrum TaxID=869889 RepID=A0A7D5SPM9_9EURY|nr:glycosyltransferase family 1 protein [Halosimplex rubrum]QLH76867.1 glycosyltransferase family 4 protein [Halosimplex rubrum]